MQYLNIEWLDEDQFDEILKELSWIDTEKPVRVFLNTDWGCTFISQVLIQEIRQMDFELYVIRAQSEGMSILEELADYANVVKIMNDAFWMTHKWQFTVWVDSNWKVISKANKFHIENHKLSKFSIPRIITDSELKKYKNNEDIYFTQERLKEYETTENTNQWYME